MKRILIILSMLGILACTASMTRANDTGYVYAEEQAPVKVWLNRADGAIYEQGESVRIHFQVFEESHVAVYNVDTEGFVHLLYPKYDDPVWLEAGSAVAIPGPYDDYNLVVSSPAGVEYVVAVASPYPLNLDALQPAVAAADYGDADYRMRVSGDPEQAITAINEDLAWSSEYASSDPYASDVTWFYVERQVPYPRYLVYYEHVDRLYDPYWDPYVHVQLRVRFEWNHHWCRPAWWCYGCRPIYTNWFFDPRSGRRHHWKTHYVRTWGKPGVHRDKPLRWVEVKRDRRQKPKRPPVVWTNRPGGLPAKNGHAAAGKPSRHDVKDKALRVSEAPHGHQTKPIRQAPGRGVVKPAKQSPGRSDVQPTKQAPRSGEVKPNRRATAKAEPQRSQVKSPPPRSAQKSATPTPTKSRQVKPSNAKGKEGSKPAVQRSAFKKPAGKSSKSVAKRGSTQAKPNGGKKPSNQKKDSGTKKKSGGRSSR